MKQILLSLLFSISFIGCAGTSNYFDREYPDQEFLHKYPDINKRIKFVDSYFVSVGNLKESILYAEQYNWYKMQDGFHEAYKIAQDQTNDKKTRDHAKYVLAFGYFTSGLYDFCASIQEVLINDIDDSLKLLLLADMARNYWSMGEFEKYLFTVNEKIRLKKSMDFYDYNDLALGYIKNGRYQECIDAINKIPLTAEFSISRKTSAAAYGYNHDYIKARLELKKAIQLQNSSAKKEYDQIVTMGDSVYWAQDYQKDEVNFSPENSISPQELAQYKNMTYSKYAVIMWFDEIFALYGGDPHKLMEKNIYPSSTPCLPPELSHTKYSFVLIEGIPFLSIYNGSGDTDFTKKLKNYAESLESKGEYLMLNGDLAIFYSAGWQAEIIKQLIAIKNE